MTFQLTVGQRGDAPLGEQLLNDFKRGDVGTIIVDAAYDSDAIRKRARQIRAKVCIKPNAGRKKKKKIQQDCLQTPQSDRTILWKNQTLSPHRHTLREKACKLRRLHLARCINHRHDLNVRTTYGLSELVFSVPQEVH